MSNLARLYNTKIERPIPESLSDLAIAVMQAVSNTHAYKAFQNGIVSGKKSDSLKAFINTAADYAAQIVLYSVPERFSAQNYAGATYDNVRYLLERQAEACLLAGIEDEDSIKKQFINSVAELENALLVCFKVYDSHRFPSAQKQQEWRDFVAAQLATFEKN